MRGPNHQSSSASRRSGFCPMPMRFPPRKLTALPGAQASGGARGAGWCADRHGEALRVLPVGNGWPVFDLVLLAVGPDRHILSHLPNSPALTSNDWTLPMPAPTHVEP